MSESSNKTKPSVRGQAYLLDKLTNQRYNLENSVNKIGRDESNAVYLMEDQYVSRHHARVVLMQGKYYVEDLESTNGTLYNGEDLVERKLLKPGDCITIGKTELVFMLE